MHGPVLDHMLFMHVHAVHYSSRSKFHKHVIPILLKVSNIILWTVNASIQFKKLSQWINSETEASAAADAAAGNDVTKYTHMASTRTFVYQ